MTTNVSALITGLLIGMCSSTALANTDIEELVERGEFSQAEQLLRERVANANGPVVEPAAVQLEILRRTRRDFSVAEEDLLAELRESIDDVSRDDIQRWRELGLLKYRVIDGEICYFRRAAQNLFRLSSEAREGRNQRRRAADEERLAKKFDLTNCAVKLVALSEKSSAAELMPMRHRVKYSVSVDKDHPRLHSGAMVRAWLPYPQDYLQQSQVNLVRATPEPRKISPNGSAHRTIYFEQVLAENGEAPEFKVEYTFVTSAYYPRLDVAKVRPYDTEAELYRQYTAERVPHIVFTPQVRELASKLTDRESNPLVRARRIFAWVSENIPWCGEMEYSIIPNLSAQGLAAGHGDCGVQGMVFITLCRAAGIPARWQSGWQTKPGDWNMHDWSEIYIEPWGWIPVDASYGLREHDDERVRYFFCGQMDPYRLIVNLDYARPLDPRKTSFRSEPNDFQRGEIEIDGHNLYFDEWSWDFDVVSEPLELSATEGK